LLSGFIFPRDTMPGVLYVFSNFIPLTHELQILRGIVVRGAGFGDLWAPFLSVTALAALLVMLAAAKFQKSMG
jgi:ABC-2 type transport system permease protein